MRTFGITLPQYETKLREQSGLCAICNKHYTEFKEQALCIDHNHTTGKTRALLCRNCNLAVGNLLDSPTIAASAAAYLLRHESE